MPRTVGVVLARMGSSRAPGKSIAEVAGKPMIVHLLERLQRAGALDAVVLATPDTPVDVPLQEIGQAMGVLVFAGAEEDVLDRLYQAAKFAKADVIVHIGGDCPFADPALIRQAVDLLNHTGADYVSNLTPMTYPPGMDTDALTFAVLERIWKSAKLRTVRKHPLAYIYQNPDEFHIENFAHDPPLGHLRWTLDYPEDLELVRVIYDRLYPDNPAFGMDDILALLDREPEINAINAMHADFIEDQPAYWDSVGYMQDLRLDLRDVVNEAIAADEAGHLAEAASLYETAQRLLGDLTERAVSFSGK